MPKSLPLFLGGRVRLSAPPPLRAVLLTALLGVCLLLLGIVATTSGQQPGTTAQLNGVLNPASLSPGAHTLRVSARTLDGRTASFDLPFTVATPPPPERGGGGGGGDGGGGGGGGEETHPLPRRFLRRPQAVTFRPAGSPLVLETIKGLVTLRGKTAFSSPFVLDGRTPVVLLAHDKVEAVYPNKIICPVAQCVLKARVRRDAPPPVQARFVVDGKTLGTVTWDGGDNTYEEKAVPGTISQGTHTLSVRLVRDLFKCSRAQIRRGNIAACNRDLYVNRIVVVPVQGVTVRPAVPSRRR